MKSKLTTRLLMPVLLVGVLSGASFQISAENRVLTYKTDIHQCFYQHDKENPGCPDGAFVSDISRAHAQFMDATSTANDPPQTEVNQVALATSEKYTVGALYAGGDQVTHIGHLYRCKPYPASNLCGQAPASYEPGTGWNWEDAWVEVK